METTTLSTFQMARELGVSTTWLKSLAVDGKIPCLKAGRRLLFNGPAVHAAIARLAAESHLEPKSPAATRKAVPQ